MVPWEVIGLDGSTPLANIVSVSVSTTNDCYANSSGNVFCNGDDQYGEWGSNLSDSFERGISSNIVNSEEAHGLLNSGVLSGITSVSAGSGIVFGLTASGTAYAWGIGTYGTLGTGSTTTQKVPVVSGFTNVANISSGTDYYFTCAVNTSGSVFCSGENFYGELGNNSTGSQSNSPVGVYGFH